MTVFPDHTPSSSREYCLLQWQSFPVEVFPEPLCTYITYCANSMGCDNTFVAIPLLSSLASAIGNTRCISLKQNSWNVPSIIWGIVIAESGTLKSPALKKALKPLRMAEDSAFKVYFDEIDNYKKQKLYYESELQNWKKNGIKKSLPPPDEPQKPVCTRFTVLDVTIEALAPILSENPRGVLLCRDELAGWFGSFDAFKKSKGSDVAQWLELFDAGRLIVDRKSVDKTIHVPRASVSITGTVQPGALQRILTDKYYENGMAARILMANPPRISKRWTENTVPIESLNDVIRIVNRLLALDFDQDEDDFKPIAIPLSANAKSIYIDYYNKISQLQKEEEGHYVLALSKFEQYAVRFALVFTLCRAASIGDIPNQGIKVDQKSMADGIQLASWFAHETKRIYNLFTETGDEKLQRKLIEFIRRHGGEVTFREICHGPRIFRGEDGRAKAESALRALIQLGVLKCEYRNIDGPGKRVRTYILVEGSSQSDLIEDRSQINVVPVPVNKTDNNNPIHDNSQDQIINVVPLNPENEQNQHIDSNQCSNLSDTKNYGDWGEI